MSGVGSVAPARGGQTMLRGTIPGSGRGTSVTLDPKLRHYPRPIGSGRCECGHGLVCWWL
jgi:hypothetical protein